MATVGLAGLGTMGVAKAATSSTNDPHGDPQSSIIEKIASKFNLNKDEVKKVFDEDHTARQAEHEARMQQTLDQLVKDGKLTQEQADKLTAKAKELKADRDANRDSMKDKSESERKSARDAKREELKKWLSDNGISEEYARFLGGGGRGHGHGDRGQSKDGSEMPMPDMNQ